MSNDLSHAFEGLVKIMDELREKCPWDRKQTIQSLRQMTIEEMYELADAITAEDWKGIKEELGDLLLHIIFYAKIGSEKKQFELRDVIDHISQKLISRHPHIYPESVKSGDQWIVNNEEDVKKNWEKLKIKEGKTSVLSGVPVSLPSLVKAMRLQEKARQTGFEWDNKEQVWEKVEEETNELKTAIEKKEKAILADDSVNAQKDVEEEFGDLLFSLVNYARFLQVDAENALERTNKKFIHRFTQMEQEASRQGKSLQEMSLSEMDAIWNTIKQQHKS
jgi:MazG family protein